MNAETLFARFDALNSERQTFLSHWQEVADFVFPRRADFTTTRTPGEKRQTHIFDATGTNALELLAAGLHGMATNPASRWFSLKLQNAELMANTAVKRYLADVEDIIFGYMHSPSSSITTHLHELYLDYAAFGTAVMFIGKAKNDNLLFQSRFLGECVIDENAEGVVDTVIRCFKMTVRQCFQTWGEKCSDAIKKMHADGKVNEKVELLHAVCPREDHDYTKKDALNMPYASIYMERKAKAVLNEGGFEEFPYAVPRWYKVSGEVYGRSPAMSALPDIKMLQEMMKTTIKGAQKQVDPPLLVPDDGMLGPVRTVPGGLNFYRGEREITPLLTGGNLNISLEMMQDLRNRIMTTFFVDQLQMVGDAKMTATEVTQRTEERMRLLGPILGRMESELLGPIINRIFGLLLRMGKLPEQPEELDDQEWVVEYVSPIALAQRGQKVERVLNALTIAGQMAAVADSGSPSLSRLKGDAILPWVFTELNADPDLLEDDEAVAAKAQNGAMAAAAGPAAMAADAFAKVGQGAKSFAEAQNAGTVQ
ncbi:portal protein [Candidatus Phyllobacterium onerii]|uniref:portal protein n=1 Tax=Candidatus Phyllobacterium onerii TaxID=3020828 RepID=UPI002330D16B|nr:portal protein [Phyllobacterium sp. IY22]